MESALTRSHAAGAQTTRRIDGHAVAIWLLAGGLVLYLALDGGGYDVVVHSQVGIVVWWIVLVGAAWAILPAARLSRAAWAGLALFAAFVGWTAIASTWSLSSERSLQDLSLVALYLGILVLSLGIYRDREHAVRHSVNAIATAIVIVAILALASRLHPGLFPAAHQTASFLPGAEGRLSWPLNYWNGLAALLAMGIPLLLTVATSSRTLPVQAAAAGAIPLVGLCGYLTFSRGGAFEAAGAVVVFLLLAPQRIPKLATLLVTAAGSAVLVAGAVHRSAIERGLSSTAAHHQGATLLVSIVLVCVGVALAQAGIGLAVRHGTPPRWLEVSPRRARMLFAGAIIAALVAALVAGAPGRLSHAWRDFKNPHATALHQRAIGRFGTVSGNGRYDYWKVAVHATSGHLLGGSGPGTFVLLWQQRAPYFSPVQNAHSLYFETLAEVGVVGLALLVGFLGLVIGAAVRATVRSRYEERVRAAAITAALVAFLLAAGVDWVWQIPVLPATFLLLGAAVLVRQAPPSASETARLGGQAHAGAGNLVTRFGAVALALACLVAIAIPLAATNAVRKSQAAAASDLPLALTYARSAARIEPGAASPQLQEAQVLEAQGKLGAAAASARRATTDEPANWSTWLVLSRIEAEDGNARAAINAYRRARSLNPRSPVFVAIAKDARASIKR